MYLEKMAAIVNISLPVFWGVDGSSQVDFMIALFHLKIDSLDSAIS